MCSVVATLAVLVNIL